MAISGLLAHVGNRATIFHEEDGTTYAEVREDVEPLLEWVKIRRDMPQDKDFKAAAAIPDVVLNQSLIDGWGPDDWKKWANDPANECFRIWKGRL